MLEEVDLLAYSAREWREETKQAKHMREVRVDFCMRMWENYLRRAVPVQAAATAPRACCLNEKQTALPCIKTAVAV